MPNRPMGAQALALKDILEYTHAPERHGGCSGKSSDHRPARPSGWIDPTRSRSGILPRPCPSSRRLPAALVRPAGFACRKSGRSSPAGAKSKRFRKGDAAFSDLLVKAAAQAGERSDRSRYDPGRPKSWTPRLSGSPGFPRKRLSQA